MTIDPSIAFRAIQPTVAAESRLDSMGKVMQMGNMMQTNEMNQMKMGAMQQDQSDEQGIRQLFSMPGAVDPTTGAPTQDTLGKLMAMGPSGIAAAQKAQTGVYTAAQAKSMSEKSAREASEAKVKNFRTLLEHGSSAIYSLLEDIPTDKQPVMWPLVVESIGKVAQQSGVPEVMDRFPKEFPGHDAAMQLATSALDLKDNINFRFREKDAERKAREAVSDPAVMESVARRIAHYSMDIPKRLSPKDILTLRSKVLEFNPSYDETKYATKLQARKNFASGVEGRGLTSIMTATGHIADALEAAEALLNNDTKKFNTVQNWWREETGSELPSNYNAAKIVLASEIPKMLSGAATAREDRAEWQKVLDTSNSWEQFQGHAKKFMQMMASRATAAIGPYQRVVDPDATLSEFVPTQKHADLMEKYLGKDFIYQKGFKGGDRGSAQSPTIQTSAAEGRVPLDKSVPDGTPVTVDIGGQNVKMVAKGGFAVPKPLVATNTVSKSDVEDGIKPGGKYAGKTYQQVVDALKARNIEVK